MIEITKRIITQWPDFLIEILRLIKVVKCICKGRSGLKESAINLPAELLYEATEYHWVIDFGYSIGVDGNACLI